MTAIEWTDETWNPTVGCSRVSSGCENCYAERVAARGMQDAHRGLTVKGANGPRWTGEVRLLPDRLDQPLHWRKPRRVFVDSMSDLFHESIDPKFVAQVFNTMAACPQHTFQILTKRPERMRKVLEKVGFWSGEIFSGESALSQSFEFERWPLPNVWLGTSIENQETADERVEHLFAAPATMRFLSVEPLLEPIDLSVDGNGALCCPGCFPAINWVIVGGESGPGARPCHVEWIRSIVEQCRWAGVPCFVKQDSGPKPGKQGRIPDDLWIKEMPA